MKKYIVCLSQEQRSLLISLIARGKEPASTQLHARILLQADQGEQGPGWSDKQICKALSVGHSTVEQIRKRFSEAGLGDALVRRPQPEERPALRALNKEQEAYLIALYHSQPPEGKSRWSFRLLANKMVELGYAEHLSRETVRQTLKKKS